MAHVQPPGGVPVGEQRVADGHRLRDALERLRAALDPQRARHVLRVSPRAERASQVFVRGAQTLGEAVVLPQQMRKRGALVRVGLVRPDGGAAPRRVPRVITRRVKLFPFVSSRKSLTFSVFDSRVPIARTKLADCHIRTLLL